MSKTPIVALGDIAHFIRGINFKPDDVVPLGTEGSVACMRTKNVQSELDLTDVWAVAESFVRRDEQLLQAGDILVSSANSWNLVGKCSWIPELPWRASFGGFVSVLRANPAHVDARFLYQWFSWEHTQALLRSFGQKTTNISNLNIERALALKLPCHPQEEQRRIAAILDQAETLRTQRRTALALLDSLTQSLFLDMFGDPVANERGWDRHRIAEICELVRGSSPRPQGDPRYFGGPVPRLMVADITRDGWLVTPRIDSLTVEGARLSRPISAGTVVMAVSGNVGLVSRLAIDACVHDGFVAFKELNSRLFLPAFFLLLLHFSKQAHEKHTAGAIFQNLTTTDIKAMQVIAPPLHLQQTFATRIASIETLKATHRHALAALDALFASLQQRAFAGAL